MHRQKGLQLIELLLAIALLAGIMLGSNVLFMGSTNQALTIKTQSEMGQELTYLFRRLGSLLQDIQPEVIDDKAGAGSHTTPYVSSDPANDPDFDGIYMVFYNNESPKKRMDITFEITYDNAGDPGDPRNGEGKLSHFYSSDAETNGQVEMIIPQGLFPYAVIKDYNKDGTTGNAGDLDLISTCLQEYRLGAAELKAQCTDKGIWPAFEISQDRKRIFASFRMGRKVGTKMIYSKPMTKMFLIRGEKAES